MTLNELLQIAISEYGADGMLSKGTRIAAIEKARNGVRFELFGSTYDNIRISAALRKTGEQGRMKTRTIESGCKILMIFN